MAAVSTLKYLYLAYLAKPKAERSLFRELKRQAARKIVEFGVGDARRTARLLQVAQRFAPAEEIQYTGIDLFEARGKGHGLPLKEAFKRLKALGSSVQLIPGDPASALARSANSLTGTDLILIGADQDAESLGLAWKFVPRMLHEQSRVFWEQPAAKGETRWEPLPHGRIHQMASAARIASRKAA